jgi:hypothetical protein
MTQFPDLFAALAAPFEASEVRTRSQAGRTLHYITARTAMNRLDNVFGPENWWDEYLPGEHSVLCRLTVRLPDGSTLTKADAGGYAGMPDQGDDDKSGFSDSFKRACVKFGIGRYLYRDGVPNFVLEREPKSAPTLDAEPQASPRPSPPAEATPPDREQGPPSPATPDRDRMPSQARPPSRPEKCPGSGRGLFAWVKEKEQRHEVGLLKYLNSWAKLQDFPGRMVEWDRDQVEQAFAEACRKLQSIATGHGDAYGEAA